MTGTCGIKIGACRHLQWRGVQFPSCHTALEEQVGVLAGRNELWQSRQEVMEEMLAHTEPGILLIAGMGAALALLRAQGHDTYVSGQRYTAWIAIKRWLCCLFMGCRHEAVNRT